MNNPQFDVIIIGTGAGGGTLGYALATTGLNILLLERGDFLPRDLDNWNPNALFVKNRYLPDEKWSDPNGNTFQPGTHYYVGGNTKFYGAALLRLREKDFGEVHHIDGISPAWPLSYQDFKPYYNEAEKLYTVHGERGKDPTEPIEELPYPCPPLSHEPRIKEIYTQLHKKGIQAFPLPIGIRLNEQMMEKSQCIRCDTCDGYPCLVQAKSDAHTTCMNPALTYPNVKLITKAKVERLITDNTGKSITQVEVIHEGKTETYTSHLVVVSCGAINSAALLLRSANDRHPLGLANRYGMVGRHYMFHNNSAIIAVSRLPNPTKFQKTIGINDFYYGASDWQYPLGHIQLLGKVKKEMLEPDAPRITPHVALEYMADHSIGWWITTEDLPLYENRVSLDSNKNIVLHYTQTNTKSHQKLFDKLKGILRHIDSDEHVFASSVILRQQIPLAGVAHQVGTCRFGIDPTSSVIDLNCKAHDLDNLYIVDGSFFPSSGAVNPGLTIIANALRIADHLCQRFNVKREKDLTCRFDSFYKLP